MTAAISKEQTKNLQLATSLVLDMCAREKPLPLSKWADEHFYLSAESSYVEGPWQTLPYQRDIMDAMSDEIIETVDIQKSARLGYTKMVVAAICYFAEHKKRNQLLLQPADDPARMFMKTHIDPALRDVEPMDPLCPWIDKKDKHNTEKLKLFANQKQLNVKGGTAAKNYRELSVDVVYYDELDGFPYDVEKEGSPTELGDKRIEGSYFPKSIRGTTPKILRTSHITAAVSEAKYEFRYEIPCPHCGHDQHLAFGGKDADHGFKWTDRDPDTVQYLCKHCASLFDQTDATNAQEQGVWRCRIYDKDDREKQHELDHITIQRDEDDYLIFVNRDGEQVETPNHIAFVIWTAYSHWASWKKIVKDFLKSLKSDTKLKTFTNTTLGEAWDDEAEAKVDPHTLYIRREHYAAEVPEGVSVLTAGVDVQDDRLEWEIVGWGKGEESWSIHYGRLYGDPSQPTLWKKLSEELRRQWADADGQLFDVKLVCIDSGGHYTDEVYNWSKKNDVRWAIPVKGIGTPGKALVEFPRTKNRAGVYLSLVGMDSSCELVYQRWNTVDPGSGYCHFPIREEYDEPLFEQFTAERRQKTFRTGRIAYVWTCGDRRNEASDCRRYATAAVRILQQFHGTRLDVKPEKTAPAPKGKKRRHSRIKVGQPQ